MFDLTGKTALVTGATGGIGGAIARALHAQGATVALSGTRREALEALAARARRARPRAALRSCRQGRGRGAGARRPRRRIGQLDILVANAGITRDNLFVRMKDEDWDEVLDVNLTATFRLARAAVKRMMRRRFGRIIGITSVVGVTGNPGQANYAASKAGMIGMTKSLGAGIAKRGITVNCVAPGFIATPMTDKLNDKQREAILQHGPGRPARRRRRGRRGGGLSGLRRGRLRHRPDPARERRNGDDLSGRATAVAARSSRFGWSSLMKYVNRAKAWLGQTGWARATCGPLATVLDPPRHSRRSSRRAVPGR